MFSCFVRLILLLVVCLTIAQAYPPLAVRGKLLSTQDGRLNGIPDGDAYDYLNLADVNDNDVSNTYGFPAWLTRSRKFCCAPPL